MPITSFIMLGFLSNPSSPTFYATAKTNLLPNFLFGNGFLRLGIFLITSITDSFRKLLSTLFTHVSRTFIHASIRAQFSLLSSSVIIYIAAFVIFSLFLLLMSSISSGFMNDLAHSIYILSSQSMQESYRHMKINNMIVTYNNEGDQFFICTAFLHVPL